MELLTGDEVISAAKESYSKSAHTMNYDPSEYRRYEAFYVIGWLKQQYDILVYELKQTNSNATT